MNESKSISTLQVSAPTVIGIVLSTFLFACTAVPPKQNMGTLTASEGVRKMFEDNPEMQTLMADGTKVRCRQIQRVGTHIHSRLCMTVEEWRDKEEALAKTKMDMMAGPCTKFSRVLEKDHAPAQC